MDANATRRENGSVQPSDNDKHDEDLGDVILEDLDSYWEDINDRLTISRMVSDSVIKGMVNAISQEAHEKISLKELEVARLKEIIDCYHLGSDENKFAMLPSRFHEPKTEGTIGCGNDSFSKAVFENDKMTESMDSLKTVAKEHIRKLRQEIDRIRGCSPIRKINSGSELVGLSGILQEKVSVKCNDVDKTVDDLQDNLDTFFKQVEDMVQPSNTSLVQWQEEQEFVADVEGMVIRNYIRSIQQEFEAKMWEQNAKFVSNKRKNWAEKIKEISSLRQELDVISKSLSPSEVGHLISYSSMDSDHSHCKVLSNHSASPTLLWEGNGKHETSKTNLPENVDPARLKHLTREGLINHFNTEMNKMSRNHESQVQEITEENFTLKRELLKEKEKSSLLKKDKEFDVLRRIPDIILKLDGILMENEKLRVSGDNDDNIGTMRNRLEYLISENHHLKDSLDEKKKEVKCLSSQVSCFSAKMSEHSLLHAKVSNMLEIMKCEMHDAQVEASIGNDVVKCFLREMIDQIRCVTEEAALGYDIVQEIFGTVFQAAASTELASSSKNESLDEESTIMQGILGVILQESLKEAEEKMTNLKNSYIEERAIRLSLEKEVQHFRNALKLEVSEKEKLEEELMSLETSLKQKEQLVWEATLSLEKEKEKLALACEEVGILKDQTKRQELLILKCNEASDITKFKLVEALQKVKLLEVETCVSKQKYEQAIVELNKANEERKMLVSMMLEHQKTQLSVEEKDKENRKQMESVIFVVQKLFEEVFDFEHRVVGYISRNNKRLERLSSQSNSLVQNACMLKRTGLVYKQRLEKRCSDLQKAEAEVDLLGDEVDTLLRLLEKIYIALDHYSPILQHYPGVVEILKLVKRELVERR